MRNLKRKRVDAPRVAGLEDVHPYSTWSMCLRVYHKFHVERFAAGEKRLSMVLLDEKGKKMVSVIYNDQVERFDPLLVEGRVYFVQRMSVEPIVRNHDYRFASSHFMCRFTSHTNVAEIRTVRDELIPLFPPFMPLDRVWHFTMDNDMYVEVIGMVLFVSSVGFMDSLEGRRVPFRKICLIDGSFNIVRLVVWDKSLTGNLMAWERSASQRDIVVVTMLWANHLDYSLETTIFTRVHFNPNIAAAHQLRKRINDDLTEMEKLLHN